MSTEDSVTHATAGPAVRTEPAASPSATSLLELRSVTKRFGAVSALSDGNLRLERHSIHAVVGENGAGKSTLVKIIGGLHTRDSGDFLLDGEPVDFRTTADAKAAGIAVIYQEPTLFPDLSVAENIFIGRQPYTRFGQIDRAKMNRDTRELTARLGVPLDPQRQALSLSIADQQIVEIAKSVSLDAQVIVMDEPTAALSGLEVDRLMGIARHLRDEGKGVIFISHRFDEVFSLCDTITVMRDGAYVSTNAVADVDVDEIIRQMVGRNVDQLFPKIETEVGDVVLQVEGLSSLGLFSDVSFDVRAGEIVCLAGLVGAGRSEIARAVFGVDPYDSGTVRVGGVELHAHNSAEAMRAGIGFVPEDRRRQGLAMTAGVASNITLAIRERLAEAGFLSTRVENRAAQDWAARLQVKTHSLDTQATMLSGGNQQKVVLAKWLATEPKLLIIDEPTRGIDVGTKSEVHRLISELAGRGLAVLMISSELPEVLGMADRILVVREGRLTAELSRDEATAENVMLAATQAPAPKEPDA
ncbi:sugar ABC transporter ATP-binding protein [Luteimicrobium xylanilyticum]|uniref:Polyamine-transporting ATPase n=1 Tax=Luteimicrobium xylanilyticum TaxID=1133546 RepID=A0A5P9Q7W5_9MICO|nr:sugar ABC transporter ATP-binding protein [Luteimicrobium xylanilyticum]QFU97162.1 Polyamine-transporting ATPase [Luteimicrobium xylanilyticum]